MSKYIFIPIKENSCRVPRKNFRMFLNHPLYLHTINKYNNLNVKLFINTDSQEIFDGINGNKKNGDLLNVTVIERKKNLIGDDISVNLLIKDFIENHIDKSEENAWIAQIHVTSPFLTSDMVMSVLEKMESKNEKYDSAASVTIHQSRFWRNDGYGFCPVNHNPMKLEKTQDLPVFFEENSCFYVFNAKNFLNLGGYRVGKNPYFYEVKFPENLDIDTEDNWKMCINISKNKE